jgi:rSAM/selenodomain-associated transferase 1
VSTLLGMFAKYWEPGKVKSRLAASIGPERAAGVQRLFIETLARRFGAVADQRQLAYSPVDKRDEFRRTIGWQWDLEEQAAGDLGERMLRFFTASLARAEYVVLIGSDSPDLPLEYLHEAFAALATHDVVLGPAADGGYYLIGAARRVPPVFDGIAWSTPGVWPQTITQLQSAGITWHTLPEWYDVDDQPSLQALAFRLGDQARADREFEALLGSLIVLLVDLPQA